MVQSHTLAHVIALLGVSMLFVGCTSDDESITTKVPRGYQRAHTITSDSWETKADGALAVAEEVPALTAEEAENTAPPSTWQPLQPSKPSLVTKLKRKSMNVARLSLRVAKKVARAARGTKKRPPRIMARAVVR